MKCHRCGSVMVYERFYGPHEHFLGWRCVLCGEIIDQVILENRQTKMDGQSRERRKE
jgi:ribosomal protein S27E